MRLRHVGEPAFVQPLDEFIRSRQVHWPRCNVIASPDDPPTAYLYAANSLCMSGLESNRSSSSYVEKVTVGFYTIEFQLWISLNQVVVRTNL